MIESLTTFVFSNAPIAHWVFFFALLLAGLNIPISADLVILSAALLAANVVPENTLILFLSVFLGCLFSAWVSYWVGRTVGPQVLKIPFFAKLLPEKRLQKTRVFYEKYGLWALIVGRFIPFGVRNCIFMSSGMSKIAFPKFVIRELIACLLWSLSLFYVFFTLGQNYSALYEKLKTFNILIFLILAVALMAFLWYKKKRKQNHSRTENTE